MPVFAAVPEGGLPLTYFDAAVRPSDRARIMTFYRRCLQRHLYAHASDRVRTKRYLAKNPSCCPKIDTLFQRFPDARFIYLARNPLETVASYISGVDHGWRLLGDPVEEYGCRDYILEMAGHWYRYPLECLDRAPQDSYILVKFDDLVGDPEQTIRDIYQHFDLAISPAYAQALREEAERARTYRSKHEYSLEQVGLTREQVVADYRDVFDRFGFDGGERMDRPVTGSGMRQTGGGKRVSGRGKPRPKPSFGPSVQI